MTKKSTDNDCLEIKDGFYKIAPEIVEEARIQNKPIKNYPVEIYIDETTKKWMVAEPDGKIEELTKRYRDCLCRMSKKEVISYLDNASFMARRLKRRGKLQEIVNKMVNPEFFKE